MMLELELIDDDDHIFDCTLFDSFTKMAKFAKLYDPLWRSKEVNVTTAGELEKHLRKGLSSMIRNPVAYRALNDVDPWGTYNKFVQILFDLLVVCTGVPEATIHITES